MDESREFEYYYGNLLMGKELPEELLETYRILECYKQREGKGTYLAETVKNQERCILKIAYGEQCKFLRAEYQCLVGMKVQEQNALILLDYQEWDEYVWLARTYCQGTPLDQVVAKNGILPEQEIITYGIGICTAILQLHERKPPVIHRDIKPENFVVTPGGQVVLVDFDTARTYADGKDLDTMFVGTRVTAAPEQFGYSQTDVRTDIYGIGRTLLYLACGNYRMELLDRLSLSSRLKRIIRKAGDFHPNYRYQDVSCLERQLRRCGMGGKVSRYLFGALVLAVAIGCSVFGGYWMRGRIETMENADKLIMTDQESSARGETVPPSTQNGSMAEVLGLDFALTFHAETYMEQIDRIITGYSSQDFDGMADICEQFVSDLYQEQDLRKGEPVDIYYFEEWPEELFTDGTARQRISYILWFHDELLRRELGNYNSRGRRLAARMDDHFHRSALGEDGSTLYYYVTQPKEDGNPDAEEVVMEVLMIIKEAME